MSFLAVLLIVVCGGVTLVWISRHIKISREHRRGFVLTAQCAGPPPQPPSLSVVVAAKDEQDNIETCVRSMLAQDYGDFEMIVANDRSSDATGEIVRRLAAQDPRVRLIDIDHLPAGWCGKNHAMQHGVAASTGDWICMVDADCKQDSPRSLSVAMQYALDTRADLLSVLPTLETKTFWERIVQPVCSGIMMIWFEPDKVNNPRKPNAYANGAFMLMSRKAYQQVGTHQAVADKVNEDMHLAAAVKRSGLSLRVVRNNGLYTVRMYSSLAQILRGWSRIFYGTFGNMRRLSASLAVLLVLGVLPYLAAVGGWAAWAAGAKGPWLAAAIVASAAAVAQLTVMMRLFPLTGCRPWYGLSYPLGCLIAVWSVVQAMLKLRKGAKLTWRGTSYSSGTPVDQPHEQAPAKL